MQFRERRRVIQVIRTTYDPKLKRGRSEVVGKIDKTVPSVTEKLQKACSAEELTEIATYLGGRQETIRNAVARAGAQTLPEQMRQAAEYFEIHQDEDALVFAGEIRAAWDELKDAMRKAGFSKGRLPKPRDAKPAKTPSDSSAKAADTAPPAAKAADTAPPAPTPLPPAANIEEAPAAV